MSTTTETAQKVAEALLRIEAVRLRPQNPFKWSSGWLSPIYCDNRLTLSYPELRTLIKNALAQLVKEHFPGVEAIAGVATAGIPQGALLADVLELPFVYVRASPKGHGMENLIEGKTTPGQKVVLVEDLISTGGSSLNAAAALKKAGFDVEGMVAIFTYGFEIADRNFKEAGVALHCLSNYSALVQVALDKGYIKDDVLASLAAWREQPETWGN
jgi:orotate phosphoribosyltransferase